MRDVALVALAVWAAVVTVGLLLCIRQIALLTHRVSTVGDAFSFASDGPEIGTELPADVVAVLPPSNGDSYVLNISASCAPCRELAEELSRTPIDLPVTALVPGREELAEAIVELLPSSFRVVRDPDATRLAQALDIQSTPFVVAAQSGVVVAKSYVNAVRDIDRMVEARKAGEHPEGRGAAPQREGEMSHVH